MRKALVTLAAGAATLVLALPSDAAGASLVLSDPAGDGNALNDQGRLVPGAPDSATTPLQRASGDILSVTFSRVDVARKPTAYQVDMKLGAAPEAGSLYRVLGSVGGCSTFWLQYAISPTGTAGPAVLRHNCVAGANPVSSTVTVEIPAAVKDGTISWTVPFKTLPVKVGTIIEGVGGEVRGNTGVVTAPVIDQLLTDKAYKIGS